MFHVNFHEVTEVSQPHIVSIQGDPDGAKQATTCVPAVVDLMSSVTLAQQKGSMQRLVTA